MNSQKIICLTGTPGTGKTTLTQQLSQKYRVIHLTQFIEDQGLGKKIDGELEVDLDVMKSEFKQYVHEKDFEADTLIVEGHLSHYLDADYCVVLRTDPEILRERLENREYSEQKIMDNVESEKLDIVLSEAVENFKDIYEINNTDKVLEDLIVEFKEAVEQRETGYGNVNWLK